MSPETEQGFHAEIERKAELEKAKISFEINLLEQDETHYRHILFPGVEPTDYELYQKFRKTLDYLESEALRISGVVIHRETPNQVLNSNDMYVQLGWMQFGPPMLMNEETIDMNKKYTYLMLPTERGMQIIDARREAAGLPSVETTRRTARKSWDETWGREPASS